jgi:hypothetical protein
MEGPQEVDPSGDVIITLRNPGAPFAEAVTEAEFAVEGGPSIARDASTIEADAIWIQTHPTGKRRHKNKEKKAERNTSSSPVYSPSQIFLVTHFGR